MLFFGMRIAVIGPSGSGKTWFSSQLAENLGLRHIEIDALHHGPNWEPCSREELRERVAAATEGDGWVSDGTYHQMIGELVFERVETRGLARPSGTARHVAALAAHVPSKEARNRALARKPRGSLARVGPIPDLAVSQAWLRESQAAAGAVRPAPAPLGAPPALRRGGAKLR